VNKYVRLAVHAAIGWAICGATVGVGRQLLSMPVTLLVHAVVAPVAFGLLTWHYFKRFPQASPVTTACAMFAIVVALDALIVAPFFEHNFAMFHSLLGTWLPLASIFAVTYCVGRIAGRSG
jgi:hypothetical protein